MKPETIEVTAPNKKARAVPNLALKPSTNNYIKIKNLLRIKTHFDCDTENNAENGHDFIFLEEESVSTLKNI